MDPVDSSGTIVADAMSIESVLDPRERGIVEAKRDGLKLTAIARRHTLSGEAVRQIVRRAAKRVGRKYDHLRPGWRDAASRLLDSRLLVSQSLLTETIGVPDGLTCYLLIIELGAKNPTIWYEKQRRGWWTRYPARLETTFRRLASYAPYHSAELNLRAETFDIPTEFDVSGFFGHPRSPLVQALDGSWLRRKARVADAAYLWMLREGEPRGLNEIAEAAEASIRSARESMRRDARFRRMRPDGLWTLTSWPAPPHSQYTNALDVVFDVLREFGPLTWDRLLARVSERYSVGRSRVQQCLCSELVGVTEDGRFDLVERGAVRNDEAEPRKPYNINVDPSGRLMGIRFDVNHDMLRGSGVIAHNWLSWRLGLRGAPMRRTFLCEDKLGYLTITRNTSGTHLSSLRVRTASMGMASGCSLLIMLRLDDDSVTFSHMCRMDVCPASGAAPLATPRMS